MACHVKWEAPNRENKFVPSESEPATISDDGHKETGSSRPANED